MAEITNEIREYMARRVKLAALGNSRRTLKDLAIDLINDSKQDFADVADGAFLHPTTIKNLVEEKTQRPENETIERILRYFGVELTGILVAMKSKYSNRAKE